MSRRTALEEALAVKMAERAELDRSLYLGRELAPTSAGAAGGAGAEWPVRYSPFRVEEEDFPTEMLAYSSSHKAFYAPVPHGVVPASSSKLSYAPTAGLFAAPRLAQASVAALAAAGGARGRVLDDPIKKASESVGYLIDELGVHAGSCVLISTRCILTARHVLEGKGDIRNFKAIFKSAKGETFSVACSAIIEESEAQDYAIIYLSTELNCKPLKISIERVVADHELALLHYPLGKTLQLSVHAVLDTGPYVRTGLLEVFHDSDFGSSGGAYLRADGKAVAIHLGSQVEVTDSFNLRRFALEFAAIVEKNPRSILIGGEARIALRTLAYSPRPYLEVETGWRLREKAKELKNIVVVFASSVAGVVKELEKFSHAWPTVNIEALAEHFPGLGRGVLGKFEYSADYRKALFKNERTGWCICYDLMGQYSTVRGYYSHGLRSREAYFDWGFNASEEGKEAQYHFKHPEPPGVIPVEVNEAAIEAKIDFIDKAAEAERVLASKRVVYPAYAYSMRR